MILTVCLSPCIDVTVELDNLRVGKTNVVKNKTVAFAGKALNVAVGVARLGGEVSTTGFMYNENAHGFESVLDKEGVPFTFVWNKGRVRENLKFIDRKAMLTEVNDVGQAVSEEKLKELLSVLSALSIKSTTVVISGGLPKDVPASYYARLLEVVPARCLKIVDATGEKLTSALSVGVDLIKPNLEELEHTLGREIKSEEDALKACQELISLGAKRVLLSLGKQGAIITDGQKSYRSKSVNVAVNSTVGAGDAMVAAAALKLEQNAPLDEILRAGVAAGTARVTTFESTSFSKSKYEEIYESLEIAEISLT